METPFSTLLSACETNRTTTTRFYYSGSSLVVGVYLYKNPNKTIRCDKGFYKNPNGLIIETNIDGKVINIQNCGTSTSTTSTTTTNTTSTSTTSTTTLNNQNSYLLAGLSINGNPLQEKINDYEALLLAGANGFHYSIGLWEVFETNIDDTPNFTINDIEATLNYFASKNKPVYLRTAMFYPRLWKNYVPSESYWGNNIAEVDEWGNKPESYAGIVQFTKADSVFTDKIANRFKTIVDFVYSKLGNNLKWVSCVTSSTYETGDDFEGKYWYQNDNGTWLANSYTTTFSYNSKNTPLWQDYLKNIYSNNITLLNTSWGLTGSNIYSNFTEIQLPKTNTAYNNGIGHSFEEAMTIYQGNRGKDFYLYRDYKNAIFYNKIKTKLKQVNNNILYSSEFGAYGDPLGTFRGSNNIKTIASIFEHIKGSTGIQEGCGSVSHGYSYCNYPNVEIGDEFSSFDLDWCLGNDLVAYKTHFKNRIKTSFLAGEQSFVLFDNHTTPKWQKTLELIPEVISEIGGLTKKPRISSNISYNQTLSEILSNPYVVKTNYINNGGTTSSIVNIKFIE